MTTPAPELGVIGAGNMAAAIVRGIVRAGALARTAIVAYDPDPARRDILGRDPGIVFADRPCAPGACRRVLLSVKPKVMDAAMDAIAPALRADATVISIAAGITTAHIDRKLAGRGHIVRVMPNTPMLVGHGVSAIAAGPRATPDDIRWVEQLFAASGRTLVMDESKLDAVTGLSGSGPAYVFYLVEAMTAGGIRAGLDPDAAATLAVQTCVGAGQLLAQTGKPPDELRRMVTTPGGTTEAAVTHLDAHHVRELVAEAIGRATARSRELGT